MPRTTRSSVSSEGDVHASTTSINPQGGSSGEGSESQVSKEGGSDPQGSKGYGPRDSVIPENTISRRICQSLRVESLHGTSSTQN